MKLRYSPTSPYVRKVTVCAAETGLSGRIERIPTLPFDPASDLVSDNPLGKVPALITDDGERLYDSRVICEYLDSLHGGPRLFPEPPARWTALRRQALGDGILDAAVLIVLERRREPALQSTAFIDRQMSKIGAALDALEAECDAFGETVDIGAITIGCALGYLDFRFPDEDWRADQPKLAAWFARFAERPSMVESAPRDPA